MSPKTLWQSNSTFAFALIIGTIGGGLFTWLGLPLSWMLGSMTACGVAAILRLPIAGSKRARPPMSAIIGAMLGTQFGPDAVAGIVHWWPALIGLAIYLLIAATLCYFYLVRIVKLDPVTGYFSAMPGGLIDMVLLGAERGGNERTIALMHSSRIFLVVFSLPPLLSLVTGIDAGTRAAAYRPLDGLIAIDAAWFVFAIAAGVLLGRLIRLPAPYLIGPMLASAILHWMNITAFIVPSAVIAIAQIVLGTTVGCRFVGTAPRYILRILLTSAGSTLILLVVALCMAFALQYVLNIPIEVIFLAFSPGGLAEMSLVALALNLEVSFVTLCHISRIAMVVMGASFVARFHASRD